jgi:anaerobic magnesium-protoporphyrin IX monomethyl ester cyclase
MYRPETGESPIFFRHAAVVVPPLRDFYFTRHRFSSLGAAIVASLLKREGLQVDILNFPLMKPEGARIEIPDALSYLKPHILPEETGKLSFFTAFRLFGPSIDKCAEIIAAKRPDICFLSVFAFCYADDAIELAEKIRKKLPLVPLVAGGAGVSAYPGYFLEKKAIDFALTGEAEACLGQFLREISLSKPYFTKVPNLVWKENGAVRVSPLRAYAKENEIDIAIVKTAESARSVTLSTSLMRGCPKQCDFCSSALMFGRKIRTPPIARLETLLSALPVEINRGVKRPVINLEDDNQLCNREFLTESMAFFRKHLPGAAFIAENGLDYSLLTSEVCEWLVKNGMSKFNLSLASTAPEILAAQGRFSLPERYEKIIEFCALKGLPSVTYFICGFKEDTLESTADNLSYFNDKQTVIGISLFYPVPGLPGFTDYALFDRSPSFLCLGSAAYPWHQSLSTETMITAFRLSRYLNLLKSPRLSETEKRVLGTIEGRKRLHTVIKLKSGEKVIIEVPKQDDELVCLFFKKLSKKKSPRLKAE